METSVLESENIPRAYFTLSIPVVLSLVITIVYNITDTYFIALTNNTDLVAGVSLCAPVFTLLMGFGNIFGQGGSSLISRLMGQKDEENLNRVSSFCFYAAIAFGAASAAVLLLLRMPILTLLGADSFTLQYALSYFTWFSLGAPFVTLSFIHSNLLRAEGMAKESMAATVSGSVVNIILDPLFIFGLGMGAAGAAIATVIGYMFTDIYAYVIVRKKSRVLSTAVKNWRISGTLAAQIFAIGTSAALSNLTQSFCLILTNQQLLGYGNDKIAAMGIVQKISMIVMLVIVGFSFGAASLVGYTFGKGDEHRMKKLLSFVLRFLCSAALVLSALMYVLAPTAVGLFLSDAELIDTGALMLRAQLIGMVFMAVVLFLTVFFQATGKALPALILALSRQGVVFAIVLFAAVRIAGFTGILYSQFAADLLSAILAVYLFMRVRSGLPRTGTI